MSAIFHQSRHPLVKHKLTYLRLPPSQMESSYEYAAVLRELGMLLAVEATADLLFPSPDSHSPPPQYEVLWPALIVVVRSGLIMAEGVRILIPSRHMGHIGVFYEKNEDKMIEFMITMPLERENRYFMLIDPFAASGRTAVKTIDIILEYGIKPDRIRFLCGVMAKPAYEAILSRGKDYEGIEIFCGHIDGVDGSDVWMTDFKAVELNNRLYGTRNKVL